MPTYIAQSTTPAPAPAVLPGGDLSLLAILIAAGGWLGRSAWAHFSKKDEAETALVRELIAGLQANNQLLMQQTQLQAQQQTETLQQIQVQTQALVAAHQEYSAAVRDLKEAVSELREGFHDLKQKIG